MASIGTTEARVRPDIDLVYVLFLVSFGVALYLLLDPFYAGFGQYRITRDLGPIKYAALAVACSTAVLGAVGQGLFLHRGAARLTYEALKCAWPLLGLGAYILGGAAYSRWGLGIRESFLPSGIAVLGLPAAIILYYSAQSPHRMISAFFWGLLIVSPYEITWIIVKRLQGGQAFHMEIFLIVPLAAYFFHRQQSRVMAWVILACMLVTGLMTNKYTGYGTLLITLAFVATPPAIRFVLRKDVTLRLTFLFFAFILALVLFGIAVYLLVHRHEYLPSGDLNVREQTYMEAWNAFLSSPIYGDAFVGTSLQSLVGITVLGHSHIPTHSDFLDILAHGGLIGISLYLYGFYRLLQPAFHLLMRSDNLPISGLLPIVTCGIFVMLFNPLLIAVPVSSLFWVASGFLVAATSRTKAEARVQ